MLSVIVSIYNVEKYLVSTLDSLINQKGDSDFEVLLIDDGSTDNSGFICDKYSKENNFIRVIHKNNGGLSSARNSGIEAANGEYILFLDGDDCLDLITISALQHAALLHPHCDVIQFRYEEVSPTMPLGHCAEEQLCNYYECNDEYSYFQQLYNLGGEGASACTKLIKRSVLGNLRFREGILHEDEEFVTHLLPKCTSIGYCSNEFYKYVMRPGSIMHSEFSGKRLDIIPILQERITYLEKQGYIDLVTKFKKQLNSILHILWNDAYKASDVKSIKRIECQINSNPYLLRTFFFLKKLLKPIIQKFINAKVKFGWYIERKRRRKKIKYTDFTIISNNCWGGLVYQYFGLPYNTPVVGCGFMDDDYIKFLENFEYYISQPLIFIEFEQSKRHSYYVKKNISRPPCPIALLGDVEICFTHYKSEQEAREKWQRRCGRINRKHMIVKMSQRYDSNTENLRRFKDLPFNNKICFTECEYPGNEFIYIPELKHLNIQGGDETPFVMGKIDLVNLINELK